MCGRYTLSEAPEVLKLQFQFDTSLNIEPRYNIAPSQLAPVVIKNQAGRKIFMFQWGLAAKGRQQEPLLNSLINARAESLLDRPSFKEAFLNRRCLVIADGFYEWKTEYKTNQPYRIHLKNNMPIAFAGIWEKSQADNSGAPQPNKFAIITTEAVYSISHIHNRMPVILSPGDYDNWLNGNELEVIKKPGTYNDLDLRSYKVPPEVGNIKNDSRELLKEYDPPQLALF
ncbi:MAG: SOS response-associated peptidase [Thalassobaculaceae bacterium]